MSPAERLATPNWSVRFKYVLAGRIDYALREYVIIYDSIAYHDIV